MILVVCIALAVICLVLFAYIYFLKRQIRNISWELERTRDNSYNRQLKVSLFDNDLGMMAAEVNKNLEHQKLLKLETEKAEKQLKQSVSDIAHDLRTPLTVVKGNLQLLKREEKLSERGEEQLRVIMERTDALREMVDDFFELSVLESDTELVELSSIDVTAFLMQFIIDNETVIREHGLTPKLSLPNKSIYIKANEMMLQRMCNNLLGNIFKYAKNEFSVKLTYDLDEAGQSKENNYDSRSDFVRGNAADGNKKSGAMGGNAAGSNEKKSGVVSGNAASIKDGIENNPEQVCIIFSNKVSSVDAIDVDKLFDRTYRGDKARPAGGAGLGLYIVKLLAEKQGAEVGARLEKDSLYMSINFS